MKRKRKTKPSNAVTKGTAIGTLLGGIIEAGAAAHGMPLPAGSGAMLAGAITGIASYFMRGGRRGEAD